LRALASLERAGTRGKLEASVRDDAVRRMSWTTNLKTSRTWELVVEAVAEIESIEVDVLRQLDDVLVSGEFWRPAPRPSP
jgi:3-hydroxybutyryl-CoA dehydrogenase